MKLGVVIAGTAIVSLAAGSVAGYFVARRQLGAEYDIRLREELESTKDFYDKLHKKGDYETPEAALETLVPAAAEALRTYQGVVHRAKVNAPVADPRPDPKTIVEKNIFVDGQLNELTENDLRNRTEEAPYILTQDEYMNNESEYTQSTLTYYAGDGVLTDSRDDRIDEVDKTVGLNNLQRFGTASGDPRVVYVRNDVLEIEFEIVLHDESYAKAVAGLKE